MGTVTKGMKDKAEVYFGEETCREKLTLWFKEIGLPTKLLEVEEIEECGHVKDTGFVWLKHKKKKDYYKFDNMAVCYNPEVTAYLERNKIKKLTGVKAKEFLIWITVSEICVKDNSNSPALITFKTPAGLSKSFPLSLFQFEDTITRVEGEGVVNEVEAKEGKIN